MSCGNRGLSESYTKGDTKPWSFKYADDAGNPADLTGIKANFEWRDEAGSSQAPVIKYTEADHLAVDVPTGTITVNYQAADTDPANLPLMAYAFDLRIRWPDGTISTDVFGQVNLRNPVGDPPPA